MPKGGGLPRINAQSLLRCCHRRVSESSAMIVRRLKTRTKTKIRKNFYENFIEFCCAATCLSNVAQAIMRGHITFHPRFIDQLIVGATCLLISSAVVWKACVG